MIWGTRLIPGPLDEYNNCKQILCKGLVFQAFAIRHESIEQTVIPVHIADIQALFGLGLDLVSTTGR